MIDEDQGASEEADAGAPAWVMTFADLMSLLMCFFVLLLAFSEMDVEKFKQLSGSMKQAFGVQREIKADEIPKGTSVVTTEFSPGIPQPTPFKVVEQQTTDDTKENLEFAEGDKSEGVNMNNIILNPYRLEVRTLLFQSSNMGSNPIKDIFKIYINIL